jgi:hypothetical protein
MKANQQIRNYFAALGQRGGSTKSQAKQLASRENGKLGGRPRKQVSKLKK